ncbi:hypothetical protein GC56T2_2802 [Geobacillus sp. C56-T2]|nr:hypothetical protein GC56T2_2802 [Geobacillus sp. C56-T2]
MKARPTYLRHRWFARKLAVFGMEAGTKNVCMPGRYFSIIQVK